MSNLEFATFQVGFSFSTICRRNKVPHPRFIKRWVSSLFDQGVITTRHVTSKLCWREGYEWNNADDPVKCAKKCSWFREREAVDKEGEADERDDDPQEDGASLLPQSERAYDSEDVVITCGWEMPEECCSLLNEKETHYYLWNSSILDCSSNPSPLLLPQLTIVPSLDLSDAN